jgi:hypothetical protein
MQDFTGYWFYIVERYNDILKRDSNDKSKEYEKDFILYGCIPVLVSGRMQ